MQVTIEPAEEGIKISGETESIGKVIYQILKNPSLFFFSQSAEWREAQDFIFKRNEEQDYCDIFLEGIPPKAVKQTQEYQIKTELKFMVVKEAKKVKIKSADIAYKLMRTEAKIDRECAWVLHLNGRLDLIEKELVSMGTVEGAFMHPREIFKKAIVNGSSSIIIIHNHPSGDTTPSEEDFKVATTVKKAGELLGIPMNDFIIIGSQGGYVSFVDEGYLK